VADLLLLYASTLHWVTCGKVAACLRWSASALITPLNWAGYLQACVCFHACAHHRPSFQTLGACFALSWLEAERGYRGITSAPVPLNLEDLTLDRAQNPQQQQSGGVGGSRPSSMQDLASVGALGGGSESEGTALTSKLPGGAQGLSCAAGKVLVRPLGTPACNGHVLACPGTCWTPACQVNMHAPMAWPRLPCLAVLSLYKMVQAPATCARSIGRSTFGGSCQVGCCKVLDDEQRVM